MLSRGFEARRRGQELEGLNHFGEAVALARSAIKKQQKTNIYKYPSSELQISSRNLWIQVLETPSFPGESSFTHPKTKAKHEGGGGVAIITNTKWAKIRWGIGIHLKK